MNPLTILCLFTLIVAAYALHKVRQMQRRLDNPNPELRSHAAASTLRKL